MFDGATGRGIAIDADTMGRGITVDAGVTRSALATVQTKRTDDAATMWRAGNAVSMEIALAAFAVGQE